MFPEYGDSVRWLPLLRRHAALIEDASTRVRVTSVTDAEVVRRHYAESLELLRIADQAGWDGEVCDVGSGGGYPGLVFGIMRPDVTVHLVEPLHKRAGLLESVAAELGLANVHVYAARAEDAGRGPLRDRCGLVTARAVAGLRELLEYTAPFAADGALIALPKGSAADTEVEDATTAIEKLALEDCAGVPMRPVVSDRIRVLRFRKRGPTADKYPRRAGIPGKRPL